jgi:hypothetical protein
MRSNDSSSIYATDKALKLILVWKYYTLVRVGLVVPVERDHLPRMNFSTSLSRSRSIIFAGGGWRTSSGLYVPLDLRFPTCRMR